jgi:hypothetical protein
MTSIKAWRRVITDMPKIKIDHKSSIPASSAIEKIQTFFETDSTLKQIDSDIKCSFDAAARTGKVLSSKFKADIVVQNHDAGSLISVTIDLPLLLTPFKGKVEEVLKHKLEKYLA